MDARLQGEDEAHSIDSAASEAERGSAEPQRNGTFSLNGTQVVGIVGMALYWTWFFMVMFSDSFLLPLSPDLHIEPRFREVCFLSMSACFALALAVGKTTHNARGFALSLVAAAACSPWAATYNAFATEPFLPIEGIVWIAFGFAAALLLGAQAFFLKSLELRATVLALGVSATAGGCLYFILAYTSDVARLVTADCLPILAAACMWLTGIGSTLDGEQDGLLEPDPIRHLKSSIRIQPAQPFYGFIFGLALNIGISASVVATEHFPMGIALAFCLAGPAMFAMALFPRRVDNGTAQWFLLPVAVAGLMFTTISDGRMMATCGITLAFCYSVFDLLHTLSLVELMREQNESTPYVFAAGKILLYGGTIFGWGLGNLLLASGYHTMTFDITVLGSAAIVVFALAAIGRPSARATASTLVMPANETTPSWDDVCARIAEEAGLSPRQTEVFLLLAKGRNAPYIEEELVISYHTVKAHIYRIYQKLEVHTHQELIDMVEGRMAG